MNRRHFLSAALASVAPLFVADAFAVEVSDPLRELDALTAAFVRAQDAGRPLLVIVIPKKEEELYDRGHAWGELLMNAGDDVMARLGEVDVVCAGDASFRQFAGRPAGEEPWFWVLPTSRLGARPVSASPSIPEFQEPESRDWSERERLEDEQIDQRIAALSAVLVPAIDRIAGPLSREKQAALVERAVATLRQGVPANTHWANSSGCGTSIEGVEENWSFGCGMGFVPARSRRFLYFFDVDAWKKGLAF